MLDAHRSKLLIAISGSGLFFKTSVRAGKSSSNDSTHDGAS